jgi:hypothetical protein
MNEVILGYLTQCVFAFTTVSIMLFCSESLGYSTIKSLSWLQSRLVTKKKVNKKIVLLFESSLVINIFTGLLVFAMILFYLGVARLYLPILVILVPLIISIILFIFTKAWERWRKLKSLELLNYKPLILGNLLAFAGSFGLFFRPALEFDATWYHLTIPKLFLQAGNIDYVGSFTRYSVHPFINFFWNSWYQAFPVETGIASIAINLFQAVLVFMAIYWIGKILIDSFNFRPILSFLMPLLLVFNISVIDQLGIGYNDLFAYAYGITCFGVLLLLDKQNTISKYDFNAALLIIGTLALTKIFFTAYAFVALLFLVYITYLRSEFETRSQKIFSILLSVLPAILVFGIPWIIRSYYFTGRPLDPIGTPGLSESQLVRVGSSNWADHFLTTFWERLPMSLYGFIFTSFGILFLYGLIAILNQNFNKKYSNLWVLNFASFCTVFIITVILNPRYFFAPAAGLMIAGLLFINELYLDNKVKPLLKFLVVVPPLFTMSVALLYMRHSNHFKLRYLGNDQTLSEHINQRLNYEVWTYYNHPDFSPSDMTKDEKIMVIGLTNMGYVENPILEYRAHPKEFEGIDTAEELIQLARDNDIRFIMSKGAPLDVSCKKRLNIQDPKNCTSENPSIKEVLLVNNVQQYIQWIEIVD